MDAPIVESAEGFNSRSRMGSDTFLFPAPRVRGVSIHAPAWGATICAPCGLATWWFQFTLPHGERQSEDKQMAQINSFNSRSRMGSDHKRVQHKLERRGFNSRSRMGSDCIHRGRRRNNRSFNSRSRMGSDHPAKRHQSAPEFQFTLPHGERRALWLL